MATEFSADTIRPGLTVWEVFVAVGKNPARHLVRRWNWKTALLSLGWRGAIFMIANLSAGVGAGLHALLVEACYRPVLSGFLSALIQAFRYAAPKWLSTLVLTALLPALTHMIEIAAHSLCGTKRLGTSIVASIAFTAISSSAELLAMRRGLLVVGELAGRPNRAATLAAVKLHSQIGWLQEAPRKGQDLSPGLPAPTGRPLVRASASDTTRPGFCEQGRLMSGFGICCRCRAGTRIVGPGVVFIE